MIITIVSFLILLLLKVPIAFSLFISCALFFLANGLSPIVAVNELVSAVNAFSLLAIPGFILAGNIMNGGGITERIFDFANKLVGSIRGGLGHANVMASMIFSGMSGAAVADAAGLGAVELKAMKKEGYDENFSLAITGASSLIGPIIPPSIPAVIFGVTAGVSIGKLFIAGIIPGIIMALVMFLMIYIYARKRPDLFPERVKFSFTEAGKAFKHGFWALLSPVIILGGIMLGIVTPTEAAILAVVYSLIVSFFYRDITWKTLLDAFKETLNTTVAVMLIVGTASIFGWILSYEQAPQLLAGFFLDNISNKWLLLFVIMLIVLVVGMFMETIAAITILTPVLLPVVIQFGIDPVHFGIIMILNLMIGLLTPPVGMVLYVLESVSKVSFVQITRAVFPYVIVMFLLLLVFTYVPIIVTFLPDLIM